MTDECDCRECTGEGPVDITQKGVEYPTDGQEPEPTEDLPE